MTNSTLQGNAKLFSRAFRWRKSKTGGMGPQEALMALLYSISHIGGGGLKGVYFVLLLV